MNSIDLSTLAARVRFLRGSMSQTDFGEICGLRQATVSDLERGDAMDMGGVALAKLCAHYRVTPEWLMLGTGETPTDRERGSLEAAALQILRAMDQATRKLAVMALRGMGGGSPPAIWETEVA